MSGPVPTSIWPMEWRERIRRYSCARAMAYPPGDVASRVLSLRERMKPSPRSKGRPGSVAADSGRSV